MEQYTALMETVYCSPRQLQPPRAGPRQLATGKDTPLLFWRRAEDGDYINFILFVQFYGIHASPSTRLSGTVLALRDPFTKHPLWVRMIMGVPSPLQAGASLGACEISKM